MDRRDFLKTTGGLLASAAVYAQTGVAEERPRQGAAGGRKILPMNRNWRYHPGKIEAAPAPALTTRAFSRVVIPHTNVRLPWHSFDDKDYEFVSTYRRRFRCRQCDGASASLWTSKAR